MPAKRLGRQTVRLSNPVSVVSYASIGGKLEAQGPLAGYFDELSTDSFFGCKTWEKGEAAMQRRALERALQKGGLSPEDILPEPRESKQFGTFCPKVGNKNWFMSISENWCYSTLSCIFCSYKL